jgi:hypothetical protein
MEVSGQLHIPAALTPGVSVARCVEDWLGARIGLNAMAKRKESILDSAENWTPVIQPVV